MRRSPRIAPAVGRPARPRGSLVALLVLTASIAAACTDGGSERTEAGRADDVTPPEAAVDAGPLTVERRWVGPEARADDIVALEDGRMVALLSTEGWASADAVAVSDDGIGWEQVDGPFSGTPGPPSSDWLVGPTAPRLWDAGDVVIASRSTGTQTLPLDPTEEPPEPGPGDPRIDQDLAVSVDGGHTWDPLAMPAPEGARPVVADVTATASTSTVVAVGTIEHPPADGSSVGRLFDDLDAFDAAVWVSDDGGRSFAFVDGIDPGHPGLQVIHRVEPVGSRVVAMGITTEGVGQHCCFPFTRNAAWVSDDAGRTWDGTTDADVLGTAPLHPRQWTVNGDSLSVGIPPATAELAAGSTTWTAADPSAIVRADRARVVDPSDQDSPATWIIDSACDCQIAYAGRLTDLVDDGPDPRLGFHDCRDTSVRGETSVEAPVALGDTTAALAWCNDQSRSLVSVAWIAGGGWDTKRLTDLAPEGSGDLAIDTAVVGLGPRAPWVATDGAMIVLATAVPADSPEGDEAFGSGMPLAAGPLVVVRITAADRTGEAKGLSDTLLAPGSRSGRRGRPAAGVRTRRRREPGRGRRRSAHGRRLRGRRAPNGRRCRSAHRAASHRTR